MFANIQLYLREKNADPHLRRKTESERTSKDGHRYCSLRLRRVAGRVSDTRHLGSGVSRAVIVAYTRGHIVITVSTRSSVDEFRESRPHLSAQRDLEFMESGKRP